MSEVECGGALPAISIVMLCRRGVQFGTVYIIIFLVQLVRIPSPHSLSPWSSSPLRCINSATFADLCAASREMITHSPLNRPRLSFARGSFLGCAHALPCTCVHTHIIQHVSHSRARSPPPPRTPLPQQQVRGVFGHRVHHLAAEA